MKFLLLAFLPVLASCGQAPPPPPPESLNSCVIRAVKSMPHRMGYDARPEAVERLAASVTLRDRTIHQDLNAAGATFCSGATYLVFLRVVDQLQKNGTLRLSTPALARLANLDVKDGEEVFGRWNANGPGAARLFHDLKCGINFTAWESARPGDFLKMWWTDAIGGQESGHLVVYLGHDQKQVRFWSANQPDGYGTKSVPRNKIKRHLFSRLTHPSHLARATRLSPCDSFLARMLHHDFTWGQVVAACGVIDTP